MFRNVPESDIDRLIESSERLVYKLPANLEVKAPIGSFYLIINGKVELTSTKQFGKIFELGPGEVVGLFESSIKEQIVFNARSSRIDTVVYKIQYKVNTG